jgi:CelD/BcsL family acetyltransferase involved in cellulose biosynthesis
LSRNTRQQLASSFRKCETPGTLKIEEANTAEVALQYFDALKDLHSQSWARRGMPHAFQRPYFEEFHRALIEAGVPSGAVQVLRISADAEVIGYLYNLRYGNKVYAYQSGFADGDPDLRPGYVCHALAIEQCAQKGVTEYDFLCGDNRLKRSFGKTEYAMGWHRFARPSLLLRLETVASDLRASRRN